MTRPPVSRPDSELRGLATLCAIALVLGALAVWVPVLHKVLP